MGGEEYIRNEVEKLLRKRGDKKVSTSDLQQLERKIEREIKTMESTGTLRRDDSSKDVVLASERSKRTPTLQSEKDVPIPVDNYLVFSEAMEYQHKRDEMARQKQQRKKQLEMKKELDEQVNSRKSNENEEKKVEDEYAQHVNKVRKEWEQDQRQRKIN